LSTGASEYFAASSASIFGEVRKWVSRTAPFGFLEYAETTRLWPPRIPALPPPCQDGSGATLNLPLI